MPGPLDRRLTAMPLEARPLDPAWQIMASAFHTVSDSMSYQTYGRGVDADGVYADFSNQYNVRPAGEFNANFQFKMTVAFQLYASGDGMVLENDALAFNTDGIELYYESSTNKFYYLVTRAGGGITQITTPCPSQNVAHTYVSLYDRGLNGAAAVVAAYVDGAAQALTTVASSFTAGPLAYQTMSFMARNGASLRLTGRLRNLHIASGNWSYEQIVAFQSNPYVVFAPDRGLYSDIAAGGGSAAQSRFFLAA